MKLSSTVAYPHLHYHSAIQDLSLRPEGNNRKTEILFDFIIFCLSVHGGQIADR